MWGNLSASDRLQSVTDQFGRTYDFSYNADGYLENVNDFADRDTTVSIDSDGLLTQVIVADEPATYEYPNYVAPEWNFEYVRIGGHEYLETVSGPNADVTNYDYKLATRRIRSITYADGSDLRLYPALTQGFAGQGAADLVHTNQVNPRYIGVDGEVVRFRTDGYGNTVYQVDGSGAVSTFGFDLNGQLVRYSEAPTVNDDPIPVTQLGYSETGDLVLVINDDEIVRTGEFDPSLHKVTQWTVEDTNTQTTEVESYEYDSVGNLIQYESVGGEVWTLQFDTHGNLLSESKPDPDGAGPLEAVSNTYAYDPVIYNLLTTITVSGSAVRQFVYSESDQVVEIGNGLGQQNTAIFAPDNSVSSTSSSFEADLIQLDHSIQTHSGTWEQRFVSSIAVLSTGTGWFGPALASAGLAGNGQSNVMDTMDVCMTMFGPTPVCENIISGVPIIPDDPPPPDPLPNEIFFATREATAPEGVTFEIIVGLFRRNDDVVAASIADFGQAQLGGDYLLSDVDLVFEPDETEKIISVHHRSDDIEEIEEHYQLLLKNIQNAVLPDLRQSHFTGTISVIPPDNPGSGQSFPTASFMYTADSGVEGNTLTAYVALSGEPPNGGGAGISIGTTLAGHSADYTDFELLTTSVAFTAQNWMVPQPVLVSLATDAVLEDTESFGLRLVAAYNAMLPNPANGTEYFTGLIEDATQSDPVLNLVPAFRSESEGSSINLVAHVNSTSHGGLVIPLEIVSIPESAAVNGQDWMVAGGNLSITILDGQTTGQLRIDLLSDTIREEDEFFALQIVPSWLSPFSIGNDRFDGTIEDLYPNAQPYFTSTPVVDAYVGSTYEYHSTASDADNDSLAFHRGRIEYPDGYDPGPANDIYFEHVGETPPDQHGVWTWNPPAALAGQTVSVEEIVWDQFGDPVSRTFEIYVHPTPNNGAPVITSEPDRAFEQPINIDAVPDDPTQGNVYPEFISVTLAEGQEVQVEVSIDPTVSDPKADIVLALDLSGSMTSAIDWLQSTGGSVLQQIEDRLEDFGILPANTLFGLVLFGSLNFVEPQAIAIGAVDVSLPLVFPNLPAANSSADLMGTLAQLQHVLDVTAIAAEAHEHGQSAIHQILDSGSSGEIGFSFRGDAVTNLILITADESESFSTSTQDDIVAALLGSPDSTFDDVKLTTITMSRFNGNDGEGNINDFFGNHPDDWVLDATSLTIPASGDASEPSLAIIDFQQYAILADFREYYPPIGPQHLWANNWSIVTSLEFVNDGNAKTAQLIFGQEAVPYNTEQIPDNHFYLELDATTDTWFIASTIYGVYEFESTGPRPDLRAGESIDVELRHLGEPGSEDGGRFDLFINGEPVGSTQVPQYSSFFENTGSPQPLSILGVGADNSTVSFDYLKLYTFDQFASAVHLQPAEATPFSITDEHAGNAAVLAYLNDFGTVDGASFDIDLLGVDFGGAAYKLDGSGSYERFSNPGLSHSLVYQSHHYNSLSRSTNGSVWNLAVLRPLFDLEGGIPPSPEDLQSFSNAFATALAEEILYQNVEVVADSLLLKSVEPIFVDPDTQPNGSHPLHFRVTFVGDGRADNFNLRFLQGGPEGPELGRIPVFVSAGYSHDFEVVDAENDVPFTFSFDADFVPDSGNLGYQHLLPDNVPVLHNSGRENLINDRLTWDTSGISVVDPTTYQFRVLVRDAAGMVGSRTWTVELSPPNLNNQPPEILAIGFQGAPLPNDPIFTDGFPNEPVLPPAEELRGFSFQIVATDPDLKDQNELRFYLQPAINETGQEVPFPDWLRIDRNTGLIYGRPGTADIGFNRFSVLVSDGRLYYEGGSPGTPENPNPILIGNDEQNFLIHVNEREDLNAAPRIVPIADIVLPVGQTLNYQVVATDADNNQLVYGIASGPLGLSIHPDNGTITWQPGFGQSGVPHAVAVSVSDGEATVFESFEVLAIPGNREPVFDQQLPDWVTYLPYVQPLTASDPDGNVISYQLLPNANPNNALYIDESTSEIKWDQPVAGLHLIGVRANDGAGGIVDRYWYVQFRDDGAPLLNHVTPPELGWRESGTTTPIGDLQLGIQIPSASSGVIYFLHSSVDVHTRLPGINSGNADHLIAVNQSGGGAWEYSNGALWLPFSYNVQTDHLIAQYNYGGTVTLLEYSSTLPTLGGIPRGFTSSNLRFIPGQHNGINVGDDFGVSGTYVDFAARNHQFVEFTTTTALGNNAEAWLDHASLDRQIRLYQDAINVQRTDSLTGQSYYAHTWTLGWNPQHGGVFDARITLDVDDGTGDLSTFDFELNVDRFATAQQNAPPVFTSDFLGPFAKDSEVVFPLEIFDLENHETVVGVYLSNAPGLGINNPYDPDDTENIFLDNVLRWTPLESGVFQAVFVVQELYGDPFTGQGDAYGYGAYSEKVFTIYVADNAAPSINLLPADNVLFDSGNFGGYEYTYDFNVVDPNGLDVVDVQVNPSALAAGVLVELIDPETGHYQLQWNGDDINTWLAGAALPIELPVVITATDNHGGETYVALNIRVVDPNVDPSSGGNQSHQIPAGSLWQLPLQIDNPAGHALTWTIEPVGGGELPEGFAYASNGLIQWQPPIELLANPDGSYSGSVEFNFDVTVSVDGGQDVEFNLAITVVDPTAGPTHIPQIDQSATPPPTGLAVGQTLVYQPQLGDANTPPVGTVITWSLDVAPAGMTIDPVSGRISWTPTAEFLNQDVSVRLRVSTETGAASTLTFPLTVRAINLAPTINNSFPTIWGTDRELAIQLYGRDAENDLLRFALLDEFGMPLDNGPGIAIDQNGQLTWPNPAVGNYFFNVRVYEAWTPDSYLDRPLNLVVWDTSNNPINYEPLFFNYPHGQSVSAFGDFEFEFDVIDVDQADNPGNPPLIYALSGNGGTNAQVVGNRFIWNPAGDPNLVPLGWHSFQISVTDQSPHAGVPNNVRYVSFDLFLTDNHLPEFTLPDNGIFTAYVDTTFVHQVSAHDADNDPLTYSIIALPGQTLPVGLTIDRDSGVIRWDVGSSGNATAILVVQDDQGGRTEQQFSINVNSSDVVAPTINAYFIGPDGQVVRPGDRINALQIHLYEFFADVRDNFGSAGNGGFDLFVYNTPGNPDNGGGGTNSSPDFNDLAFSLWGFTFQNNGGSIGVNQGLLEFTIVATDDADNTTEQTLRYYVQDETTSGIAKIEEVDQLFEPISDRFEVLGNAFHPIEHPEGGSYDLKLISLTDPNDFVYLARNEPAYLTGGVLGVVDGTQIPSGHYRLYLEVYCDNGAIQAVDERIIEVKNEARLGNLDLAFTDLQVTLGGVPIPLVRTYNSGLVLNVDGTEGGFKSDFSPGWNLNFLRSSVSVSHPLAVTTQLTQPFAEDSRILVTLPDGSEHRFSFDPIPLASGNNFIPYLNPDPGQGSELFVLGVSDDLLFRLNDLRDDGTYIALGSGLLSIPSNFGTAFVLQTENGLKYIFDINNGQLTAIEDFNGARVEIVRTATEVRISAKDTGSNNQNGTDEIVITIQNNRIVSISDIATNANGQPDPNTIIYQYANSPGSIDNLTQVIYRSGKLVTYGYDNQDLPRHLTSISDNGGIEVLGIDYFDSSDDYETPDEEKEKFGRLQSVINANGTSTGFDFLLQLPDGRSVRSTNTTGITIEEVVNGRGDVLAVLRLVDDSVNDADKRYLVTISRYNLRGLLTHQSKPFYITGAVGRYDALPPELLDADESNDLDAWASVITYDVSDRVLTSRDASGGITTNFYDDENGVFITTDPYGIASHSLTDPNSGRLLETFTLAPGSTVRHNHLRYQYNSFGHQTAQIQVLPGGSEIVLSSAGYNNDGFLVWSESISSPREYYAYGANGQQILSWRQLSDEGAPQRITIVDLLQYNADDQPTSNHMVALSEGVAANLTFEIRGNAAGGGAFEQDDANQLLDLIDGWFTSGPSSDIVRLSESTSFENERGLVIRTERISVGTDGSETTFITQTVYDSDGRVEYQTDEYAAGLDATQIRGTRAYYDNEGRIERTDRLIGLQITIDASGESILSSGGTILSWNETEFDPDTGRVLSTTNYSTDHVNSGLTTFYFYNLNGQTTATLTEAWNAAGNGKVQFLSLTVYDDQDRAFIQTDSFLLDPNVPFNLSNGNYTLAAGESIYATKTIFDLATDQATGSRRLQGIAIDIGNAVDPGATTVTADGQLLYTTHSIYELGRLIESRSADGQVTNYEFDGLGRQVAVISAPVIINGVAVRHRTETVYNDRGQAVTQRSNIEQRHLADGTIVINDDDVQETHYQYDDAGNLIRTTFDDGSYSLVRYDSLGRRIAESQQVSAAAELRWNSDDQTYEILVDSDGDIWEVSPTRLSEYDSQGRLIAVKLPWIDDPATPSTALVRPTYEYEYDSRGNQTVIRDPLGRETHFTFDAFGRQITRTLPLGFGPDGQPNTADDNQAEPFTEYFFHDDYGRQVLHISFEGVASESNFDSITGRLIRTNYYDNIDGSLIGSYQDFDNANHTVDEFRIFGFDNHGRRDEVTFSDGRIETTTFTDQGQIETLVTPEGLRFYEYDQLGRQIRVSFSGSDFQSQNGDDFENVTEFSYDELGRLATVTVIERNNVVLPTSEATSYGYELIGNLDNVEYSSGLIHEYQYDDLNRLTDLLHWIDLDGDGALDSGTGDTELLASFEYELRADGKRTRAEENYFDESGLIRQSDTYWDYDALGRLLQEEAYLFDVDGIFDFSYIDDFIYDLVGNRIALAREASHTTTYEFDANDRLLNETKTTPQGGADLHEVSIYGYTKTQQTSKTVYDSLVIQNSNRTSQQTFVYNLQGQLKTVSTNKYGSNGTTVVHSAITNYEYDAAGNRVTGVNTIDADGSGNGAAVTTRTEFLTDTQNHTGYSQVLKETQFAVNANGTNGAVQKQIVYAIGHDQISQTVTENNTTATHYFGSDGHGSVRVLYDLAAAVVAAGGTQQIYHFDAYGNLVGFPTNQTPFTSYLYSGESLDFNTGHQYLRARFYDPSSGRFLGLDPFAGNQTDPQSFHKYAYVHGDPIQGIDPTGQFLGLTGLLTATSIHADLQSLNAEFQGSVLEGFQIRDQHSFNDALIFRFVVAGLPVLGAGLGGIFSRTTNAVDYSFALGLTRHRDHNVSGLLSRFANKVDDVDVKNYWQLIEVFNQPNAPVGKLLETQLVNFMKNSRRIHLNLDGVVESLDANSLREVLALGKQGTTLHQNITRWEFYQVWSKFRDKAAFYFDGKAVDIAELLT